MSNITIATFLLILSISTYYLRIYAFKLSRVCYSKHISDIGPDINPFMEKAIKNGKLFDFKYFLGSIIVFGYLCYFLQTSPIGKLRDFILGLFLFSQLIVCTTSIINILLFSYLNKHENQLEGKITFGREFGYLKSASINVTYICVFTLLFLFLNSFLLIGGIVAFLTNILSNYIWYRKSIKQLK